MHSMSDTKDAVQ